MSILCSAMLEIYALNFICQLYISSQSPFTLKLSSFLSDTSWEESEISSSTNSHPTHNSTVNYVTCWTLNKEQSQNTPVWCYTPGMTRTDWQL